jgi:hypothetical protein
LVSGLFSFPHFSQESENVLGISGLKSIVSKSFLLTANRLLGNKPVTAITSEVFKKKKKDKKKYSKDKEFFFCITLQVLVKIKTKIDKKFLGKNVILLLRAKKYKTYRFFMASSLCLFPKFKIL